MTNKDLRKIIEEELETFFEEASKEEIKDAIIDTLKDEGGASGLDPLEKAVEGLDLPEGFDLKDFLDGLGEVGQHRDGDYILDDEEKIKVMNEYIAQGVQIFLDEKKKKKSSGKKDACYHKVKSRYDVWPSAYASGALVKCRKVGAKNWGNKSKKNERLEVDIDAIVNEEIDRYLSERCQKGYKTHPTRKTKKMFGRTYRNCVKAEESMDPATNKEELEEKLTDKPSSESSLRDWFGRKGEKGSKSGWVDCNTCRKDKKTGRKKCSACGRSTGEKRAKYPSCRPTPGACGKKGNYGKKSKSGKKG
tara:strand:+ start:396 stop:1310 length:915 start_codon:yes stop_codon:yes gene_type:complete